mmetsp:Transcript_3030/g.7282  ORF Transcript_3030/g.7282 Transcript_3030/m.7282 type:complete len:241 (+) Transcript_3030:429-1151(+)
MPRRLHPTQHRGRMLHPGGGREVPLPHQADVAAHAGHTRHDDAPEGCKEPRLAHRHDGPERPLLLQAPHADREVQAQGAIGRAGVHPPPLLPAAQQALARRCRQAASQDGLGQAPAIHRKVHTQGEQVQVQPGLPPRVPRCRHDALPPLPPHPRRRRPARGAALPPPLARVRQAAAHALPRQAGGRAVQRPCHRLRHRVRHTLDPALERDRADGPDARPPDRPLPREARVYPVGQLRALL